VKAALKKLCMWRSYGKVESVRLRSVPVALDAGMPRRAAVLLGKVDADRATAHAYVVFSSPEQARAALAHNMRVVSPLKPDHCTKHEHWMPLAAHFLRVVSPETTYQVPSAAPWRPSEVHAIVTSTLLVLSRLCRAGATGCCAHEV